MPTNPLRPLYILMFPFLITTEARSVRASLEGSGGEGGDGHGLRFSLSFFFSVPILYVTRIMFCFSFRQTQHNEPEILILPT